MDIVSSVCFLLLTSSDKLNDFCGEPVPMKTMRSVTAYFSSFELLPLRKVSGTYQTAQDFQRRTEINTNWKQFYML